MICSMRIPLIAATAVVAVTALVSAAHATIIPVSYHRLGETDPSAAAGNTGNNPTDDAVGSNNLARTGSPVYSSNIAASAVLHTASTLSMNFGSPNGGNVYAQGSPVTAATSNFGMEGWFNLADTSGTQVLVLNGTGGNGYSLLMSGGQLTVLQAGVAVIGTGFFPTANTWFYAALVNTAGANNVYINNNAPISLGTFGYVTPTTNFSIGGQVGPTQNLMKGLADEVRMFTFTAGQFSTNDLLINQVVPEPSSLIMLLFGGLGLWLMRRKNSQ